MQPIKKQAINTIMAFSGVLIEQKVIGVCNWDVKSIFANFFTPKFHRFHLWLFMFYPFGVRNFQRCTNPEGVKCE